MLTNFLPFLLQGAFATLKIALASLGIGFLGGLLIGVLNCRKIRKPYWGIFLHGFVWIVRGTPLFVQILLVYYALPQLIGFSLSPFAAGVLALGLNSTAYVSEIVRAGIDAIPDGQWEAAYILGLNPWQTLQGIIFPQMLRITLPSLTNELTAMIKETSILMIIGVAELTKVSKDIVARELNPMTIYLMAAALYLSMTSAFSWMTHVVQKRWQV
jgi:polar amino acid transport system permease protein